MYDDDAKKLGVKVIAKVESNNAYDAINYNDPITVGVVQWFGNRAANILNKMRLANVGGAWAGVAPSLSNNLKTIDQNSEYWNSRYLTETEGESLRPVLEANHAIQNEQIVIDFEVYKDVAISYGFNPDTNTDVVLFFFCMHHQSPASALAVILTVDENCTLDEIYNATMDTSIPGNALWEYVGRYTEARDMIALGDSSGVELPGEPTPEPGPTVGDTDPDNSGEASKLTDLSYAESAGASLFLRFKDGSTVTLYHDGRGRFLPTTQPKTTPVPPKPDPDPDPDPDPPEPTGEWFHPLPGSIITSPWGPRGWDGIGYYHWGTDFSTPGGAGTLRAVTDMVITVATDAGEPTAGTYVKGHALDGSYTFSYAHMVYGSLRCKVGDTVRAGAVIGTEGATGNVTGRHCHFEIYPGNLPDPWAPPYGVESIDPVPFLQSKGVNV